jgi:serine/threonine-protein kinase
MSEPTAVSDPRIGSVLQERYRILERLAAGGMGMVYRGERLEVGKPVAIKFLHAWAAQDEDFRKRFQVEARAMSRLTHPCCVSVIDFGVDQDAPFMVMDFVTGETLRGLLRDGPLPLGRVLGVVRQVLAGLAHAHAQNIIHRDIKPENIIVTHAVGLGEQVRILDFGLARLRDEVSGLTAGMMMGTPAYMAPEQIHGEPVGPPTDLYATGVLLFELLTGKKPFTASGNAELLRMHREVAPPLLREAAPGAGFSAGLEATVARAMAKAPGERFQSAAEFLDALDRAAAEAVLAQPPHAGSARSSAEALATEQASVPEAAVARDTPAPAAAVSASGTGQASVPVPEALGTGSGSGPATGHAPGAQPVSQAPGTRSAWAPASGLAPASAQPVLSGARSASTSQAVTSAGRPSAKQYEATVRVARASPLAVRLRSRAGAVGAAALLLGAGVAAWAVFSSEPSKRAAPASSKGGATPAKVFHPKPEALPGIEEAQRLVEAKQRDAALAALKQLATQHPSSAYVRYLEGNVNFDNLRWVDGVASYRAALRNNAAYRNAPVVIQNAIRCLVSDRFHGICKDFLRKDLGEAAVPYLQEAARSDPMANVRLRASELLR